MWSNRVNEVPRLTEEVFNRAFQSGCRQLEVISPPVVVYRTKYLPDGELVLVPALVPGRPTVFIGNGKVVKGA